MNSDDLKNEIAALEELLEYKNQLLVKKDFTIQKKNETIARLQIDPSYYKSIIATKDNEIEILKKRLANIKKECSAYRKDYERLQKANQIKNAEIKELQESSFNVKAYKLYLLTKHIYKSLNDTETDN